MYGLRGWFLALLLFNFLPGCFPFCQKPNQQPHWSLSRVQMSCSLSRYSCSHRETGGPSGPSPAPRDGPSGCPGDRLESPSRKTSRFPVGLRICLLARSEETWCCALGDWGLSFPISTIEVLSPALAASQTALSFTETVGEEALWNGQRV